MVPHTSAGMRYIQKLGPSRAGGAAGVIYQWLGIRQEKYFPREVKRVVTATGIAKYHDYGGGKQAIHVVGPGTRYLCGVRVS